MLTFFLLTKIKVSDLALIIYDFDKWKCIIANKKHNYGFCNEENMIEALSISSLFQLFSMFHKKKKNYNKKLKKKMREWAQRKDGK